MNVLSLCDGMSCGHIALDRAGIKVDKYFASEIKEIAIKVTMDNYPETIQVGDVNKISYRDGVLHTERGDYETNIDLVLFGSPCQTFSIAMKTDKRIGLADEAKSGLFIQCYRVLKEVNPAFFLVENVASMKDDDRDFISSMLGVSHIELNSKIVGAALRARYYWTNIPQIHAIIDKGVYLNDILDRGYSNRDKARNLLVSDSRPLTTPVKMFHRYFSTGFTTLIFETKEHYERCVEEYIGLAGGKRKVTAAELDGYEGDVFNGVRYMNQLELERCQTVPEGYTKCLSRNDAADVLGDGWTIDIVSHILSGISE